MKKINFQNNGQPAINDTNLNAIQDNIENEFNRGTKLACITAKPSAGVTITTSGAQTKLTLDTIVKNNSEFSLSNGGIVCPFAGEVLVTAGAMINPRTGYCGITITKNSSSNAVVDYYEPAGTQNYGAIETANRVLEVAAGDVLYLYVSSVTVDDKFEASTRTRLTVMYIDYAEEE